MTSEASNILSSRAPPEPRFSALARVVKNPAFACLLLVAVTLAVYWPVRGFDFCNYDDPAYFSQNDHVLGGLTWSNALWAFRATDLSSWYPVMWLSFMLDVTLLGKGPAGPHLVNLFFHTANTILLFLLLRRLTGSHWRSAVVAGLFALHPLHVESVAWIAERKGVLSGFFGFLSLLCYVTYVAKSKVQRSDSGFRVQGSRFKVLSVILHPPPSLCYCLALWCFALGLLSKPVLVTLPLVMLLLDCWPLKRAGRVRRLEAGETPVLRLLLEKIPFLLLAAGSALATFLVHQETGAFTALGEMPMPLRLENGFVACARYLGKTFWPADLAVLYPHPGNWPAALVFFSAVLVLGVSAVAVWQGRRRPYVLTGWFWFLAMLLPVLGIIQWGVQSMADRFTYLPLAGVFVMLVWGAAEVCVLWGVRGWALLTVAAVVLSACGAQTRRQLAHWRNSEALFRHTLAVTRNNAVAWNNLGIYLSATGRSAEAEDCFRKAVEIEPGFAFALNNYGMALVARGRVQEAIGCYRRAIELIPDNPEALRNLAAALVEIKEYAEAISCYEASLRLEPAQADTRAELGGVLLKTGRRTEAASSYWEALRLNPDYAEAHYRLGVILLGDGDKTGAMAHWRTAARLAPESPEALNSLAWALATGSDSKLRDGAEAVALANRAVQATRSKSPGVLDTLAAAYAEAGRFGEAVTTAQQALNLASAAGKEPLAKEIQTHLNEYKAGRPHRE